MLKPASGAFGSAGGSGAFGVNPTGSGGFSVFAGQPSAFGLGAGQSNNSNPSNALSSNPAFGQSSFGGNAPAGAPGVQQSAFGAPSAFGAAIQPASTGAFGAPAPVSAFAQPASAFGSVAAPQSAFGSAGAQPQSVFGSNTTTATPSSFVTAQPTQAPLPPKPKSTMPDFANFKARYQPGLNKYDDLLPQNYLQLLPKAAREAFESATFEWGKIPEWIPPKELR